jgi:hypothetical protein
VSRSKTGTSWDIHGTLDDLHKFHRREKKTAYSDEIFVMTVGPKIFKEICLPPILGAKPFPDAAVSIEDQARYADLEKFNYQDIDGLIFENLKEGVLEVSGPAMEFMMGKYKFRSCHSREKRRRAANNQKISWIASPDRVPELLEIIHGAADLMRRIMAAKKPVLENMVISRITYDSYRASGDDMTLMVFGFPGLRPFHWSRDYGGSLAYKALQILEFNAWIAEKQSEIQSCKQICDTSGMTASMQDFLTILAPSLETVNCAITFDAPWVKLKSPYIEGFNDDLKYSGWTWLPRQKLWVINVLHESFNPIDKIEAYANKLIVSLSSIHSKPRPQPSLTLIKTKAPHAGHSHGRV